MADQEGLRDFDHVRVGDIALGSDAGARRAAVSTSIKDNKGLADLIAAQGSNGELKDVDSKFA